MNIVYPCFSFSGIALHLLDIIPKCASVARIFQCLAHGLHSIEQITSAKWIVHGPSNARGGSRKVSDSENLALNNRSVEKAQAEDDGSKGCLLPRGLHCLADRNRVGGVFRSLLLEIKYIFCKPIERALEVSLEPRRCLAGDFVAQE